MKYSLQIIIILYIYWTGTKHTDWRKCATVSQGAINHRFLCFKILKKDHEKYYEVIQPF